MLLKTNIKYIAGTFICVLLFVSHPVNMFAQPADFTGKTSEWDGCRRYDFTVSGHNAIVVVPQKAAKGNPWIWRPAFFGAFPSVDKALLKKGFHIAYFDVTHLYGSPRSVLLGNDFYVEMTHRWGLSPNVTLEGFSRGGYFAFNWAAENTDKIACLYVDAPVCNMESWPGRKRTQLWSDFLKEWGITDSEVDDNFRGNALNKLSSLYAAHIPIIAVCGDSDKTVPFDENMKKVYDAYKKMGGKVKLIVKHGCDHHPHSLTNPEPIVKFIMRHQKSHHKR